MSSISTIVVLDTETNGRDPEKDAVLEIAGVVLALPDGGDSPDEQCWSPAHHFQYFLEHEGELDPEARAVHHIRPEQVRPGAPDCLPRDAVIGPMLQAEVPGEMMYAAHNAPFDRSFLKELTLPWIDTCQCARHIWPEAPSYGNQVLRYWLGAEPPEEMLREPGQVMVELPPEPDGVLRHEPMAGLVSLGAHRALYDTACTAEILREMLLDHSPEELLRLSTAPVLLKTCHLKKYRGVPWADVPRDYLSWIVYKSDIPRDWDQNLEHTVRHYLAA